MRRFFALPALAVNDLPGGPAVNQLDLHPPASKMAADIITLHNGMLIVCLVIFIAVFGVMFYSIFKHRKSKGAKSARQRIHGMWPRFEDNTFRHLLLPIWLAAYVYGSKTYRFLVNGMSWEIPGGKVEPDETPEIAGARECLEETGLIVRATDILDVIAGREHERGADFVMVFAATVLSGELTPGDDADRAEWFDPRALPPLAFKATETILRRPSQNRTKTP